MNTNIKILIAAFLFYLAENCYFGFNSLPQSAAEGFCDMIVIFLMIAAAIWNKK